MVDYTIVRGGIVCESCGLDCPMSWAYYHLGNCDKRHGAVAQLGERIHGMNEVDGSNPSSSTQQVMMLE